MFITFEGLDFSGKSTQVRLLIDYLKKNKKKVKVLREPGGTVLSEDIRSMLLDKKNIGMTDETELLLFSASRAQLIREVILPHLERGYYVISDRFHDSTTAYQGFGRGIDKEFVKALNSFVVGNALPDLTIFLDIPINEVVARRSKNSLIELDRIEQSENNFYERVRKGYLELNKTEKRFVKVDGMQTIDYVHRQIIKMVADHERENQ